MIALRRRTWSSGSRCRRCCCTRRMIRLYVSLRIAVPALLLHAANDPFIRITAETRRKISSNPNITFVETEDGGHCAFIGSPVRSSAGVGNSSDGRYDDGYWAENEIVNFLRGF